MSHTKYHTEAFVIKGFDTGETDRYIKFLTEDFGLIGVHARGVRKCQSKQRTFLQDLSKVKVSLIRGRNMWRLAHVEDSQSVFALRADFFRRCLVARVLWLTDRFSGEGESSQEVYRIIEKGFLFTEGISNKVDLDIAEDLMVVRLFYKLGYVAPTETLKPIIDNLDVYNLEILNHASLYKKEVEDHIYHAIEESGL